MIRYKRMPDEDREKFQEMLHYAFQPHKEEVDYEEDYWLKIGDLRGIYDGEDLLAVSSIHTFETLLRGNWLPMGGITAVATPPENRHQGNIKTMMKKILSELREKEIVLSSLWPFSYPFYDKLGWRSCDRYTTYEFDPEALAFAAKKPAGKFRQVSPDEVESIVPTYRNFIRKFNLPLKRSPDWWRYQRLSQWNKTVYCYLWEQNNDVEGYVIYSVEKGSEGNWKKELKVDELAYETKDAFFHLLRFLYNHGSQMSRITLPSPLPEGLSLLDLVEDPREVDAQEKPGIMVRCTDVETALRALTFPKEVDGDLVMTVDDPLLEENSGRFSLDFNGNSQPKVGRLKRGSGKSDISLNVGSLAQLYTGHLSPRTAIAAGNITLETEGKLSLLEKIFPKKQTLFYDGF